MSIEFSLRCHSDVNHGSIEGIDRHSTEHVFSTHDHIALL